jgi:hypothetical protein
MWPDSSSTAAHALSAACDLPFAICLQINVVMDYANGGSLFEYVQARTKLPEALARCDFIGSCSWSG